MTHVVVLGSVNFDLIVSTPHLPLPGETVMGSDVAYQPGGKGSNQAVAAHRLGADTLLIAATGDDHLGANLRTALANEGIDTSGLTTESGVPTGVALIVVDDHGENSIVVAPGANRRLGDQAVANLADVVSDASVLALQIEVPVSTSRKAAEVARNAGASVLLNAAPLPAGPTPEFAELLRTVDVLVLNEGEAVQLTGARPATDRAGWLGIANQVHEYGPSSAVITLGNQGAVASDSIRTFEQPAFAVDVVDTTGAGDAFSGALAMGIGSDMPLADSLRFACATAAIATTRMGAQRALPTADEVKQLLDRAEVGD